MINKYSEYYIDPSDIMCSEELSWNLCISAVVAYHRDRGTTITIDEIVSDAGLLFDSLGLDNEVVL